MLSVGVECGRVDVSLGGLVFLFHVNYLLVCQREVCWLQSHCTASCSVIHNKRKQRVLRFGVTAFRRLAWSCWRSSLSNGSLVTFQAGYLKWSLNHYVNIFGLCNIVDDIDLCNPEN